MNVTKLVTAAATGAVAGAIGTLAMDLVWFRRARSAGSDDGFAEWEFSGDTTGFDDAGAPAQVGKRAASAVGAELAEETAGTVTTLFTAPWEAFSTHFGVGSRAAHLAMGAREIDGPLDSLRRDVDDLDDLRAALALGVGTHTARAVEGWELPVS